MPELLIYTGRCEASSNALSALVEKVAARLGEIALPLPSELCKLAIFNPDEAFRLLSGFGRAFVRLWGWAIDALRDLMRKGVECKVKCVIPMDEFKTQIERSIEVARLVLRARLTGRLDEDSWIKALGMGGVRRRNVEASAYVTDDYLELVLMGKDAKDVLLLSRPVPTPIDILRLAAYGLVDKEAARIAVKFAVRYIGEYVVESLDLTDAFRRLLNDEEYMNFIKGLDLPFKETW